MAKNTAKIGKADERMIVRDLEKMGYQARRQPGSGNRAVDLQHDVVWQNSPVGRLHIESKYRRDSQWKQLEKYRAGADILTLRCDNRLSDQDGQRMVFMSWELFLDLVGEHQEPPMDMQEVRSLGGKARATNLSAEERSQIAKKAAQTRWGKRKIQSRRDWPKRKLPRRATGP